MSSDILNRRQIVGAGAAIATATVLAASSEAQAAEGGRLTIHILDLHSGVPAEGVPVELSRRENDKLVAVKTVTTLASGRPDGPLLEGAAFTNGRYQVAFDLSAYFKKIDSSLPAAFSRKLLLEFEVYDSKQPHHVPLQCTPWTQACSVLPG
jgi:5-hydroxyisourate hydrolase